MTILFVQYLLNIDWFYVSWVIELAGWIVDCKLYLEDKGRSLHTYAKKAHQIISRAMVER